MSDHTPIKKPKVSPNRLTWADQLKELDEIYPPRTSKTAEHIAGQKIVVPDARNQPEQDTLRYLVHLLSDMQAVIYTGDDNHKVREVLSVVQNVIKGYIK